MARVTHCHAPHLHFMQVRRMTMTYLKRYQCLYLGCIQEVLYRRLVLVQFRAYQPGPATICVSSTLMTNDTLPYATASADPEIEIAKLYDLIVSRYYGILMEFKAS